MPDETSSAGTATQAAPASSGATVSSGGTATSTTGGATVTSGGTATQSSQPTSTPASSGTTTSGGTASSASSTPTQSSSSASSSSASTGPSGFHADNSGHLVLEVGVPFSCPLTTPLDATTKLVGLVPPGVYLDVANKRLVGTPTSAMTTTLIIQTAGQPAVPAPIVVTTPLTLGFKAFNGEFSQTNLVPAKRSPGSAPALSVIANGGTGANTYTFSISGISGLSIDVYGNITGNLPAQPGIYSGAVTVSDNITSLSIQVTFDVTTDWSTAPVAQSDAAFWSSANAFWNSISASMGNAPTAPFWTYNGVNYTPKKTIDLLVGYIDRFVNNPTVAGWNMVSNMCSEVAQNLFTGSMTNIAELVPGSAFVTMCVFSQLASLGGSPQDATRILRTHPAIVLTNNYKNIAKVVDLANGTNTDLLS